MRKILHIITGLEVGGAERSLANFIVAERSGLYRHSIVVLAGLGHFGPILQAAGISVAALNIRNLSGLPSAAATLIRVLRERRPDVIHGWMYHGALVASVAACIAPGAPKVAWNIRQSLTDLKAEKPGTRRVIRALATLPLRVDALVYNSTRARLDHEVAGFPSAQAMLIPNGFDTARWRPDCAARMALRRELNIADDARVLGFVGRYHPVKNVPGFLMAARRLLETKPKWHLLVAGEGIGNGNPALAPLITALPHDRVHFLGRRDDIERIMPAFDLFCLSSESEAFPNVLGEAMACGIACVATDVGDCRLLLDGCGTIVPPGNPMALAHALMEAAELDDSRREQLGRSARHRIEKQYGLGATIASYQALYASMTKGM